MRDQDRRGAAGLDQLGQLFLQHQSGLRVDLRGAVKELPAALTSGASSVVTGSAYLVVELLITLFALFYLFRDRRPALWTIRSLLPLSERETD